MLIFRTFLKEYDEILEFIVEKVEKTKNIDLAGFSWCEIVLKCKIEIQSHT